MPARYDQWPHTAPQTIAANLTEFLRVMRFPLLLPRQSGIGDVGNAAVGGQAKSNFRNWPCGRVAGLVPGPVRLGSSYFRHRHVHPLFARRLQGLYRDWCGCSVSGHGISLISCASTAASWGARSRTLALGRSPWPSHVVYCLLCCSSISSIPFLSAIAKHYSGNNFQCNGA